MSKKKAAKIERFSEYDDDVKVKVDLNLAKKVNKIVSKGLSFDLGKPKPGRMCVEAAVCYAIGQQHGDHPICVDHDLSRAKIELNDNFSGTNKARAHALRRVAIAQLGTRDTLDTSALEDEILNLVTKVFDATVSERVKQFKTPTSCIEFARYVNDLRTDLEDLQDYMFDSVCLSDFGVVPAILPAIIPKMKNDDAIAFAAEILTQALIAVEAEGTKFLHLVPLTAEEKKKFAVILPKSKKAKGKK